MAKTTIPATYPISSLRFGTEVGVENCWIENTVEGIDEPGKWALNTQTNTIYLWPVEETTTNILAPRLVSLVEIAGDPDNDKPVRGIHLDGLEFCHTDRETWEIGDAGLQHDYRQSHSPLRPLALACTRCSCLAERREPLRT